MSFVIIIITRINPIFISYKHGEPHGKLIHPLPELHKEIGIV